MWHGGVRKWVEAEGFIFRPEASKGARLRYADLLDSDKGEPVGGPLSSDADFTTVSTRPNSTACLGEAKHEEEEEGWGIGYEKCMFSILMLHGSLHRLVNS